jgi:hypothetical protein
MKLKSVSYSEFRGEPSEWVLDELTLEDANLLVGKNATGKSRTLSILKSIAMLISGPIPERFLAGSFKARFASARGIYDYTLSYENYEVVAEELRVNDSVLLVRGKDSSGRIFTEEVGKDLGFEIKPKYPAVHLKRDKRQHPFLEELHEWAASTFLFEFGGHMGRTSFVAVTKSTSGPKSDEVNLGVDTNQAVEVAKRGLDQFREAYRQSVVRDMQAVGFPLISFGVSAPANVQLNQPQAELLSVWAQEKGVAGRIEQTAISQGMFRALSLLITLNYLHLRGNGGTLLIDDVGEGLDFERASALIKLLCSKAERVGAQIVMASNDRFVMNAVPLKYWTVLTRERNRCRVSNYANSKELFDSFKYTGLSNFDFFASQVHNTSQ